VHPEAKKIIKLLVVMGQFCFNSRLDEPAIIPKNGCTKIFHGLDEEAKQTGIFFSYFKPATITLKPPISASFLEWRI